MNSPTIEYKKKVWRWLEALKPEEPVVLETVAKEETRADFVEAIKEYMRSLPYDGWISFNDDFTKIVRHRAPGFRDLERK